MDILQIVVMIFSITSFAILVLLVSAWKKRRNGKEDIYRYVKKNTGIDKRRTEKPMDIPNELKKIKKSPVEKNFEELFWPLVIVFYNSLLFLFLSKIQFVFWSVSSLVILFVIAMLVWAFAINDYFFTLVPAMQAKARMLNEDFYKILMSYTNKILAFEDPINYHVEDISTKEEQRIIEDGDIAEKDGIKNVRKKLMRQQLQVLGEINSSRKYFGLKGIPEINDPCDIVPDVRNIRSEKNIFLPKFMRGVYWVGIPPFYKIYSYRFRWASFEQKYDEKSGTLITRPVTTEKTLRYITLKDDIYNMTVESAETSEVIPLNIEIALTVNITNPRKALFKIEKWLEVVINQVGAKIRKFVGTQGYFQLIQAKDQEKNLLDYSSEKLLSDRKLEFIITAIRLIYGVNIKRVQIKEINPATKEAEEFIRASIQEFISARQSAGWEKEAVGLKRKFGAISEIPGGVEMYIAEQYGKSDIGALSFGGVGHYPTFPISHGDAKKEKKGGEKK